MKIILSPQMESNAKNVGGRQLISLLIRNPEYDFTILSKKKKEFDFTDHVCLDESLLMHSVLWTPVLILINIYFFSIQCLLKSSTTYTIKL